VTTQLQLINIIIIIIIIIFFVVVDGQELNTQLTLVGL